MDTESDTQRHTGAGEGDNPFHADAAPTTPHEPAVAAVVQPKFANKREGPDVRVCVRVYLYFG